jgi:1-acyl-sn-glycerol-3-phosphate acyltransferase
VQEEDAGVILYYFAWSLLRGIILPFFGRWRVTGRQNVPRSGGVILAPNHVSYSDPPVVGAAVRRRVRFMAKWELFQIPVLGRIIRNVGAFPVKQSTADRGALKRAMELLNAGDVVCIFPEGTRNLSGELLKAELGMGLIALKSRAPVVPMALVGTENLLPAHSVFLKFSRVRVLIGKPVPLDDLYERSSDREALEEVGTRVMAAIADLKAQATAP